ncbi:MAG: PQQ-binding-like beta-propeller repeat protein [Halosimplex sp.]
MTDEQSTDVLTRRRLLRTGGVVGTGGVAGAAGATLVREPLPAAPDPQTGTWPLAHRGPRNTARIPRATPPDDPAVRTVSTTEDPTTLVVGGAGEVRRIVVGGYSRVAAHEPDGSVAWRGPESDALAIRPGLGQCYLAAADGSLREHALGDGRVRWETDLVHESVFSVVPTTDGLFVPFNGGIDAYDAEGEHRYTVSHGDGIGYAGVAIGDEDGVYVTDVGMVERLAPRSLLDELRGRPPPAEWRVEDGLSFSRAPIVEGDEVYVTHEREGGRGGVVAADASGSVRWWRELGDRPVGAALGPERLFVGMGGRGSNGDDETPDRPYRLYALDRGDGSTVWSTDPSAYYADPVVAGETLLAREGTNGGEGRVRAFERDGQLRWTVDLDGNAMGIAPVRDRVYAVTDDGSLRVLS